MSVVSVGVRDQSGHASLVLYSLLIPSTKTWLSSSTVLVVTRTKCMRGGRLTTSARTQIEVDPGIDEANSLSHWVQRKNCPVNETFLRDLLI